MKNTLLIFCLLVIPGLSQASQATTGLTEAAAASVSVRSVDWVAPYVKRLSSQAYEADPSNAASDDMSCFEGSQNCELCALGTTAEEATKALSDVATAWQKLNLLNSVQVTAVSLVGDAGGTQKVYTSQACGILAGSGK